MSELNYVPSWLDSAMTLLEKLNKCIEKIETIVNTVVSVTKTADDALSLAKANETDINTLYPKTAALETKTATLETKTATLETKTTALETDNTQNKADIARLDNNISSTRELTDQALSTANRAETKAETATAAANSKSPKLYLHAITLNTGSYRVEFFSITEESKKYSDKIKNGETFFTILKPFNCILSKSGDVYITKSLTLQLTDITLNNQNCNGSITFAAYLGDNNQIVTITDYPEWYSATIEGESVTEL